MVSPTLAQAILNQRVPDIVGSFNVGREQARQGKIRTLSGLALQEGGGASLKELEGIDPEIALSLGESIRAKSANDISDFVRDAKIGERFLLQGNTQGFLAFANQRSNILRQQGRDTTQTDRARDLVASGQTGEALQGLQAFSGALDSGVDATARQKEFEQFTQMEEGPEKEAFGRLIGAISRREGVEEVRQKSEAREGGRGIGKRQQDAINRGVDAADSTANLRRALVLLGRVETGGIDAANLAAKRFFGVEGADEGELSNRLGVAVLSQLKATFGAAFTAQEGARLEKLSAGFGKSPAANRRIIEQSLKIAQRSAKRGIRAAEAAGDAETAGEIRSALEFTLNDESSSPAKQSSEQPSQERTIQVDF